MTPQRSYRSKPNVGRSDRGHRLSAAALELRARYQTRQQAEIALTSYLLGIALQLGLRLDDYVGFDDATGELMLREGATVSRRR